MSYVLLIWFASSMYANDSFTIPNLADRAECEELARAIKLARGSADRGEHICQPYKPAK